MNWAAGRRTFIATIVGAVFLAIIAVTLISTVSKTPSCSDGIKNEGEQGIDCGGPCPRACAGTEAPPIVRFTQAFSSGAGKTDVIAYIDNPNADAAAVNIPYTVTLYGTDQVVVLAESGTFDLPPRATTPVFIPNIDTGNQKVAQAFLSIDPSQITWYTETNTRLVPQVGSPVIGGTTQLPRISVELSDNSTTPISQIPVVIAIFDAQGNVISASSTIVPEIDGQGSAMANFTWNEPFSAPVARIDVLPVIPPQIP